MSGMNAQQLHDYFIKPTLQYMGGNYYSKEAAFLLLCTAAIESNCGEYVKQIGGPALGIWQMEPDTANDIDENCDAVKRDDFKIHKLCNENRALWEKCLIESPMYACAMARLKYSMDSAPLPKLTGLRMQDSTEFYAYYKRIYNTELGASTYEKWARAMESNNIFEVVL